MSSSFRSRWDSEAGNEKRNNERRSYDRDTRRREDNSKGSSGRRQEYDGDRDRRHRRREDYDDREYDRRDRPRDPDRRERERGRERDEDYDKHRKHRRHSRSASPQSKHRDSRPRSRSKSARESAPPEDKAKPNFGASGLLAAETNTVRKADGSSTLLKYNEPPEARKPAQGWRLYVFKGKEQVALLHIARQSAYLIGRDHAIVDIVLDHPSCSKQHAVIQYRQVTEKDEFGSSKPVIKPFVIDLESTNGTFVNDETIPTTRFYELKAGDVLKFGQSLKEYVLLHDEVS